MLLPLTWQGAASSCTAQARLLSAQPQALCNGCNLFEEVIQVACVQQVITCNAFACTLPHAVLICTQLRQPGGAGFNSVCSAGGVRCERASAYLRAKGPAFSDVLQLQGAQPAFLQDVGLGFICHPAFSAKR